MDNEQRGHTLSVKLDRDTVCLGLDCHEPESADCHLYCPEGCEEWTVGDHEHDLRDSKACNVAEWMDEGGYMAECCEAGISFPLHDGMPVEVHWRGDYYGWEPLSLPVGLSGKQQ